MSETQQRPPDLQQVINNDLFSSEQINPAIRQVLEFMEPHAQPLSEPQIRSIAYLNYLGGRELHADYRKKNKGKHPYTDLVKWVMQSAQAAASPSVFVRVIEALIPKPVKESAPAAQAGRRR